MLLDLPSAVLRDKKVGRPHFIEQQLIVAKPSKSKFIEERPQNFVMLRSVYAR